MQFAGRAETHSSHRIVGRAQGIEQVGDTRIATREDGAPCGRQPGLLGHTGFRANGIVPERSGNQPPRSRLIGTDLQSGLGCRQPQLDRPLAESFSHRGSGFWRADTSERE